MHVLLNNTLLNYYKNT